MAGKTEIGGASSPVVGRITEVRSEYTSARLILANLEHRTAGRRYPRAPGYLPPEIDYRTEAGRSFNIQVRDYDVRSLDRVPAEKALAHLNRIHLARRGDISSREKLRRITRDLYARIAGRFAGTDLIENEHVIPYTTTRDLPESRISNKGSVLLQLSRRGFATPDFNLLASGVYLLTAEERRRCVRDAIHNLEKLSGRGLGDPANPLLIAMRSAMPEYLPGFMPTFLNVGLTPELLRGLPRRYGEEAAARIRLSSRKTLLEALDPKSYQALEEEIRPGLTLEQNQSLNVRIERLIARREPGLLEDPYAQIHFFLEKTYAYYEAHFDALQNFMDGEVHYPSLILQRMVCSVIDDSSYAGVLYSRHPRIGSGVYLQYARAVYGEDLMTGRLRPEEVHLHEPQEARSPFPAVYHFWRRLHQLEEIFAAPVMVEFTGVHGTFTILQVNQAELSGVGMLTAVIDLHRADEIGRERVRELIEPFHMRQVESDAIDPKSLQNLRPFCRGVSVLPRSAVTGRIYFSGARAKENRDRNCGEKAILTKARFSPTDAIIMQNVDGICSLSPAAIHVVTTAQTLGIPALLDLEKEGVRIDSTEERLINREGLALHEGDWVTISSRQKTLFVGRAVFAPARLLRFMEGEEVDIGPGERRMFQRLAEYYREYRSIVESVDAAEFESLQDLGHAVRNGRLRADPKGAAEFVNRCFDLNREKLARRLFSTTLGMHLSNLAAFRLLTMDRQALLLKSALKKGRVRGRAGYSAGAFVIGSLVRPDAPVEFWRRFEACEIALMINEWVLHQKYLAVLDDVGERRLSRAREVILSQRLGRLRLHTGLVKKFMSLKLSGVDLEKLRHSLPEFADPQAVEVIDLLLQPFGAFYDYSRPADLAALRTLCDTAGLALPPADKTGPE